MGAQQVRSLIERFLELMREAAFADQILTVEELMQLKRAAYNSQITLEDVPKPLLARVSPQVSFLQAVLVHSVHGGQ